MKKAITPAILGFGFVFLGLAVAFAILPLPGPLELFVYHISPSTPEGHGSTIIYVQYGRYFIASVLFIIGAILTTLGYYRANKVNRDRR